MAVRYIQVQPKSDLFAPATRAFGNIAIVGEATNGPINTPVLFTNSDDAKTAFSNATDTSPSALYEAIALAFLQTPGPTVVYGVRTGVGPDWATALTAVSALDVQIVALANTALTTTTGGVAAGSNPAGAIVQLADHVTTVSNTGEDGKERIGVAMLAASATDTTIVTGDLANERMVYIAHKSTEDAAAAVAGVIAGYEPSISLLLKPVNITTDLFTPAEIATINGVESFGDPPKGQGVNWLTSPVLLPGRGIYMGEGYTGNPAGKKFIDVVRTIDDVSFRLKARLINSIGTLRISRSGLRSLIAQMEAVLDPLVSNEVIESYEVIIPVLILLDKDPSTLTDAQLQEIHDTQAQRLVQVLIAVVYAGAIHRLAITLKFE